MTDPAPARIRVFDMVAQGSLDAGLGIADARHLDLPLSELARLTVLLGVDGLRVLSLYLEHLEHVPGPDGQPTLGVPEFSARWVQEAGNDQAARLGLPPLGRNAAVRGHKAVELAGLLHALPNPTRVGARGRSFRAVLNPQLVLIQGGRDFEVSQLPRIPRGRTPGSRPASLSNASLPRIPGNGNSEVGSSLPQVLGNGNLGPVSPFPGTWGSGESNVASSQVSARFPGSGERDSQAPTSSESVGVSSLLSHDAGPGTIRSALVPALHADRGRAVRRLYKLFNVPVVAERAQPLVEALGLPNARTSRPQVLADWVAAVLLEERDVVADLTSLSVTGTFSLDRETLAERLVLGVIIGLGMRKVASWGAWMYRATRPQFDAKHNDTVVAFAKELAVLGSGGAQTPGVAQPTPQSPAQNTTRDVPPVAAPVVSASTEPSAQPPADAGDTVPAPATAPTSASSTTSQADSSPLDVAFVDRHFEAARQAFPMFCKPGSRAENDPASRARVVRLYLTQEGMSLEQADAGTTRAENGPADGPVAPLAAPASRRGQRGELRQEAG